MLIYADNAAELTTALTVAHSGDTIELSAGDYTGVTIRGYAFGGITITSADAVNQARMTNLNVVNCSGLTIKGVEVVAPVSGVGLNVQGSSNITLTNLNVHGSDAAGTALTGSGLLVRTSTNVSVTYSNIHTVNEGLEQLNNNHVSLDNNLFTDIGSDGIRGGGSNYVEISGNHFGNFSRLTTEHPDAIQFWTTNTTASQHDIDIENNVIERGTGTIAQGIFMNDTVGNLPYHNVTIAHNAVVGEMYNGIMVEHSDSAVISDNLVLGYTDMVSRIRVDTDTNVQVLNNTASAYCYQNNGAGIVQSGNATVGMIAPTDTTLLNSWLSAHNLSGDLVLGTSSISVQTTGGDTTTANVIGGTAGNDNLVGTSGIDIINGLAGADTMAGGAGNDIYFVDSYYDKVVEGSNAGIDTVYTNLYKYSLSANVENLNLTGVSGQIGIGNSLNNVMTTNGVSSTLSGGAGDDTLIVKGGTGALTGGLGHDVFQFDALPTTPVQITDFTHGYDQLNIHNLLSGFQGVDPVASGWVKFAPETGGLGVWVDVDGPGGTAHQMVEVAKLQNITSLSSSEWVF